MGKNVIRGRVVNKGVSTSESATGKATMTVNGKTYTGDKVELQSDGVYVDGKKVN